MALQPPPAGARHQLRKSGRPKTCTGLYPAGRVLTEKDIVHYQRVVSFKETIHLMEEIDEVIEAYGGWPIE